jgi:hypothetical protein
LPEFLTVRRRGGGETIRPSRGAKTQTVQHLCQAQGAAVDARALPLVFADEALIAVADLWQEASRCAADGAPGLAIRWENRRLLFKESVVWIAAGAGSANLNSRRILIVPNRLW